MHLKLHNVGKRFGKEWIFRHINFEIQSGDAVAITGPNGSGKSTLLNILNTFVDPSEGQVQYAINGADLPYEKIPLQMGIATPYLQLIEELTLAEMLRFHFKFHHAMRSFDEITKSSGLSSAMNKRVADFSSGMKQRLKLALAVFTNNSVLFLDEPTSNLDEEGIAWYKDEIVACFQGRTVIIASNQRYEYEFTSQILDLRPFKS